MNGIAFNMSDKFDYIKAHKPFEICYTIEENKRMANNNIQLQIKGIKLCENDAEQQSDI